jgi:hypothetical protein
MVFDVKFNGFMNSLREEANSLHEVNQLNQRDIFAAVDQISSYFLYVNNSILSSFEELKIEVKDRRANKEFLFES